MSPKLCLSLGVFHFLALSAQLTNGLPSIIQIGGLFDETEAEQETMFKVAVERINSNPNILPHSTLIARIERIVNYDPFYTQQKVCGLLRNGVGAIFGPTSGEAASHVASICDSLEVPHIELRWDFEKRRSSLSVNLYPRPEALTNAFLDLIRDQKWDHFALVYDDSEKIVALKGFFKEAEKRNWRMRLYQLTPNRPYRDTFWEIKMSKVTHILLDVGVQRIWQILKHAQQIGLMTDKHKYIVTSLDLHTINLEDFKHSNVQILCFQLLDSSNHELINLLDDWEYLAPRLGSRKIEPPTNMKTETALIYDGVTLLALALQNLDFSRYLNITPVSCEAAIPWPFGSSIVNYIRPLIFRGMSGPVMFDQQGYRSNFSLDALMLTRKGLQNIGVWSDTRGINVNIHRAGQSPHPLFNKTLIVSIIINKPYAMLKLYKDARKGNDRYEGYAIDLVDELSQILGFEYQFMVCEDAKSGSEVNGTWNGMIGQVMRGEVDIAIGDITITKARKSVVDFTLPFMNTGISILYKKPTSKSTTLFGFLDPFTTTVWACLLGTSVCVSVILCVVARLSPYEWKDRDPCGKDGTQMNDFTTGNSFWFSIGNLMQQGSETAPGAMSTRVIAGIWYFFTLIMVSSYIANLAAFLTVEKPVYPIENAKDLSQQEKIAYGCVGSGSTRSFFKDSTNIIYQRMFRYMESNPHVYINSNDEGSERVDKSPGTYAFLMESQAIDYIVERNCNMTQIGGLLDHKSYGVATKKGSLLRTDLTKAILTLQENGVLHILKERWWRQKSGGGACQAPKKGGVQELSLVNVGGVFVVLLIGLTTALFFAICEFVWAAKGHVTKKQTLWEAIVDDFKFALDLQKTSKKNPHKKQQKTLS